MKREQLEALADGAARGEATSETTLWGQLEGAASRLLRRAHRRQPMGDLSLRAVRAARLRADLLQPEASVSERQALALTLFRDALLSGLRRARAVTRLFGETVKS